MDPLRRQHDHRLTPAAAARGRGTVTRHARLLLAVALVTALAACGSDAPDPLPAKQLDALIHRSPPPLRQLERDHVTVGTVNGTTIERLLDRVRGYPVVINAWAQWCPPCRHEFPLLQRAALRYGSKVAFIGLNEDDSSGPALRLLARHPLPYESFNDKTGSALNHFGNPYGLPDTIFLDRDHKMTGIHRGELSTEAQLDDYIARYASG